MRNVLLSNKRSVKSYIASVNTSCTELCSHLNTVSYGVQPSRVTWGFNQLNNRHRSTARERGREREAILVVYVIKAKGMCESLPININIFALILRHTVVRFVCVCHAPYRGFVRNFVFSF